MQHYPPWNPDRSLPSIEEVIDPIDTDHEKRNSEPDLYEIGSDTTSHTSRESESVNSENGAPPIYELLEEVESDIDSHSASSVVRETLALT